MTDKNYPIGQLCIDLKNWQDSSEAYRADYERAKAVIVEISRVGSGLGKCLADEFLKSDGGGSAVGVPAQMQESNDRGLAPDEVKPEDTTQGDRPARPVTCAPSAPRQDWHYDSQGYCDNPGRGY